MYLEKIMGRALFGFLALFLYLSSPSLAIEVDAKAAILIDADNNTVLYEKNADQILPIASTTKILTGILAIEMGELERHVTISENAASTGEASIDLMEGEELTLKELLLGTLIKSGNDAAVAVAEEIAGNVDIFTALMNKKAVLLGATNSNFVNPNGLPSDQHYSTAADLAKISSYAMQNSIFSDMVNIKETTISYHQEGKRYLKNTNKLLWEFPYATGVKTGTTDAAGPCLVGSAVKDELELIAVVLNSQDRFSETEKLLDYGLNNFTRVSLFDYTTYYTTLNIPTGNPKFLDVKIGSPVTVTIPKREVDKLSIRVEWSDIDLPIKKGDHAGNVIIMLQDKPIEEIPLVAMNNIEVDKLENIKLLLSRILPSSRE